MRTSCFNYHFSKFCRCWTNNKNFRLYTKLNFSFSLIENLTCSFVRSPLDTLIVPELIFELVVGLIRLEAVGWDDDDVIESKHRFFNAISFNSLFLLLIISDEHLKPFDTVCIWLNSSNNNLIFSCKYFGARNWFVSDFNFDRKSTPSASYSFSNFIKSVKQIWNKKLI